METKKDNSLLNEVRAMLKEKNPLKGKSVDEMFEHINREDTDSLALVAQLRSLDSFRASSMSRGARKVIR